MTSIDSLTQVRQVMIFGAMTTAAEYCSDTGQTDPERVRVIASVIVDETLSYWNGRPFDSDAVIVAEEALTRLRHHYERITSLLKEHGVR